MWGPGARKQRRGSWDEWPPGCRPGGALGGSDTSAQGVGIHQGGGKGEKRFSGQNTKCADRGGQREI